jgi:N-methylhydantoinase A
MAYLGVDIGGTFTDVVVVGDDGSVTATKTSSTPPRFEEGFLTGVAKIAGLRGTTAEELLRSCEVVLHGTTVATNAVVQMRGARVGVLTTRGHRDSLPVMRSSGRAKGLPPEQMLRASRQYLPKPLAERKHIVEIDERVDAHGAVVVGLDEQQVADAVRKLVADGVDAIAICFLWSVKNPDHERRAKAIVEEVAPDVFVTSSHEASAQIGEYERFTAAALNAFLGPETKGYITRLKQGLVERGLDGPLLIMQASGGVATDATAASLPVLTIGSGPSAGITASVTLAGRRGEDNVIATDMGGTSFDVGLVTEGKPLRAGSTIENQYEFFLPRTDIRSIGSGGGSIIWHDAATHTLKVGPESAGARPGPVCYGLGGTRPTVTDANLLLGYLNPEAFLGGEIVLDAEAAEAALAAVGEPLGMSALEVAGATRRIVEAQMADLIRQMTVEKGMDPRDFALYAYGGAGGLHVAGYLAELGCDTAVVPLGTLSTTWSAYGCATSDVMHVHERAIHLASPVDAEALEAVFAELEAAAREELSADGIPAERQVIERSVDMKYPLQIHRVEVPLPSTPIDAEAAAGLPVPFAERYEMFYGKGSAFQGAGVEVVGARIVGRGLLLQPDSSGSTEAPAGTGIDQRMVTWPMPDGTLEERMTQIVATHALQADSDVVGPAVITAETTTVVIPPGCAASLSEHGDLLLRFDSAASGAGATATPAEALS